MVVFRKAIPDIFNSMYRLDPIRRSRAGDALTLPLKQAGIEIDEKVVHQILNDLADFYRRQQKSDPGAVRLMLSPPEDPFIELPALQAIGDRLWRSRGSQKHPFTLEHYQSITAREAVAASGSPAAAVLDGYLSETLNAIDNEPGHAESFGDLRLDVLYSLTDKIAHRKALNEAEVIAASRTGGGVVSTDRPLTPAELKQAVEPLITSGLIKRDELHARGRPLRAGAYDFVVRSVVSAWKVLDRRRAQEAAIRAEQEKQKTTKLEELAGRDRTGPARDLLARCWIHGCGVLHGMVTPPGRKVTRILRDCCFQPNCSRCWVGLRYRFRLKFTFRLHFSSWRWC